MTAPRITPDMIRALTAPPMAGGVHKTILLWRDGQPVVTHPGSALAGGGHILCTRADLIDAGLPERADGSLGGPVAELATTIAKQIDADLDTILASE